MNRFRRRIQHCTVEEEDKKKEWMSFFFIQSFQLMILLAADTMQIVNRRFSFLRKVVLEI